MAVSVDTKSWEVLMKDLSDGNSALIGKNAELIEKNLSAFAKEVTQLGLVDLKELAVKFARFYSKSVRPKWDEEATATLSFSLGALVEKMQMHSYGEKFCSGLREIHEFLEVFDEEEEPSEPAQAEALRAPPASETETALLASTGGDVMDRSGPAPEDSPIQQPETPDYGEIPHDAPLSGVEQIAAGEIPPPDLSSAEYYDSPSCPPQFHEAPMPRECEAVIKRETDAIPVAESSLPLASGLEISHPIDEEAGISTGGNDSYDLYAQMLTLDPGSQVFVYLAEALCSDKRWSEAIEVCRRGLRGHPRNLRARYLLGWALLETGCVGESEFVLRKARSDLEMNAGIYRLLADICRRRGEFEDAARLTGIYKVLQGIEEPLAEAASRESSRGAESREYRGNVALADYLAALLKRYETGPSPLQPVPRIFHEEARAKLKELLANRRN